MPDNLELPNCAFRTWFDFGEGSPCLLKEGHRGDHQCMEGTAIRFIDCDGPLFVEEIKRQKFERINA